MNDTEKKTVAGESKASRVFKCKKCGRTLDPIPGYSNSSWRHCPCGHVAMAVSGVPDGFEEWMDKVDKWIESMAGCSVYDLPDFAFRDAYDDGRQPSSVAREVLAEAGF